MKLDLQEKEIIVLLGIIKTTADNETPKEQGYLNYLANKIKSQAYPKQQIIETTEEYEEILPEKTSTKKTSTKKTSLKRRFGTGN